MEGVERMGNLAGRVSHSVLIPPCCHSSVEIDHERSTERARFADISHRPHVNLLAVPHPHPPRLRF